MKCSKWCCLFCWDCQMEGLRNAKSTWDSTWSRPAVVGTGSNQMGEFNRLCEYEKKQQRIKQRTAEHNARFSVVETI